MAEYSLELDLTQDGCQDAGQCMICDTKEGSVGVPKSTTLAPEPEQSVWGSYCEEVEKKVRHHQWKECDHRLQRRTTWLKILLKLEAWRVQLSLL